MIGMTGASSEFYKRRRVRLYGFLEREGAPSALRRERSTWKGPRGEVPDRLRIDGLYVGERLGRLVDADRRDRRRCQLVGDDPFVTNAEFLKKDRQCANSIPIKVKPASVLLDGRRFIAIEIKAPRLVIRRLRRTAGETGDSTIADIAVAGTRVRSIGSMSRFRPYG